MKLKVILNGGKPILTVQSEMGNPTAKYVMTLRREETNLNEGRFANFLPLPHGIQEKEMLKFDTYIMHYSFSYVVEWVNDIEGKWFAEFIDYTNPEYFRMYFELQEDVLLFKMMFPECL